MVTESGPAKSLTHVDSGGTARMVDVTDKPPTRRFARATTTVHMQPAAADAIRHNTIAKGDVLAVARIAGIQAAKQTPALIPLCHTLHLTEVAVSFRWADASSLEIESRVTAVDRTGAEMEALLAAAVTALTVYDMCKAIDRGIRIDGLRLLEKTGGRSGHSWAGDASHAFDS